MTSLPVRLHPGDDLRRALEAQVTAAGCGAAFVVAGIGSLGTTRIRFAGADEAVTIDGDLEILTMSGSIDPSGSHLHVSVSDATGGVRGGHAGYGCLVRTTAEVLIMLLPDWHFTRRADATTGYAELVVMNVDGGPRASERGATLRPSDGSPGEVDATCFTRDDPARVPSAERLAGPAPIPPLSIRRFTQET